MKVASSNSVGIEDQVDHHDSRAEGHPAAPAAAVPLSLREYARLRSLNPSSVVRAVKSGRLSRSVVRDAAGRPKIADIGLADQEWAARTDLTKAPAYVKERADVVAGPEGALALEPESTSDEEDAPARRDLRESEPGTLSLSQAAALEKDMKARLAELEYRRRIGELVDAREVEKRITEAFARCRTRLLALPRKAKAQLPHLSLEDVARLDTLVREALDELAKAPTTAAVAS